MFFGRVASFPRHTRMAQADCEFRKWANPPLPATFLPRAGSLKTFRSGPRGPNGSKSPKPDEGYRFIPTCSPLFHEHRNWLPPWRIKVWNIDNHMAIDPIGGHPEPVNFQLAICLNNCVGFSQRRPVFAFAPVHVDFCRVGKCFFIRATHPLRRIASPCIGGQRP